MHGKRLVLTVGVVRHRVQRVHAPRLRIPEPRGRTRRRRGACFRLPGFAIAGLFAKGRSAPPLALALPRRLLRRAQRTRPPPAPGDWHGLSLRRRGRCRLSARGGRRHGIRAQIPGGRTAPPPPTRASFLAKHFCGRLGGPIRILAACGALVRLYVVAAVVGGGAAGSVHALLSASHWPAIRLRFRTDLPGRVPGALESGGGSGGGGWGEVARFHFLESGWLSLLWLVRKPGAGPALGGHRLRGGSG